MRPLLATLLDRAAPGGTENRIRRGIMMVAAAVVVLTALPVLLLSLWQGQSIEARRVTLVAEFVARNLEFEIAGLRAEVAGLAAAPIVGTAVTDTAGREAYLRPFLQQRSEAMGVGMTLRDYRGRPLLRLAEPEDPAPRRPPAEPTEAAEDAGYVVTAPISLFYDRRVVGALEARAPWSRLLRQATRGLDAEAQFALLLAGRVVQAERGPLAAAALPHRMALPGLPAGVQLELAYGAKPGRFIGFLGGATLVVVVINLVALLMASRAAQRIAHSLTAPLARLVAASRRFSEGAVPDLGGTREVREIAELADALSSAFAAREQAQQEMRLYTERLLEGLPVVVISGRLAPGGEARIDYLSPGVARVFGWAPEELTGTTGLAALLPAESQAELRRFMQRLHAEGAAPEAVELALRRRDGAEAWASLLARVTAREGDMAAFAGTLVDVTAERALRAQAISAAKLATLGEMAAGLAHELNQPLAVMSLAADNASFLLERQGAARIPDAIGCMNTVAEQAARGRTIIDHLRIFARGDDGALEPISLLRAAEGATILVGAQLRDARVALDNTLPEDLPPVMARLVPAEQLLVNLLINARDALQEAGTLQPRIRIGAEVTEAAVVMTVRDNGPGFPPALMDRIFQPFFTTKAAGKGTGLGLSICHGIMRSFGGGILAAAAPGGGAEIRLSFRRADRQPEAVSGPAAAETPAA